MPHAAARPVALRPADGAQVGIGTMIVFIATVLVAAVAAGVIIDVSAKLQQRTSQTGDQATKQVASNLAVDRIVGTRGSSPSAADPINGLNMYVRPAAGATDVDLKQVKIIINDGAAIQTVAWAADNVADADGFSITEKRDDDDSISANPVTGVAVLTSGDLVMITINLDASGGINMELDPRAEVGLEVLPEQGSSSRGDFTTPASYGTDAMITLL